MENIFKETSYNKDISYDANLTESDIQLLEEFNSFEKSENNRPLEDFEDTSSFDEQVLFNELPELEPLVFNQDGYIRAHIELEREIIEQSNDENYGDLDDLDDLDSFKDIETSPIISPIEENESIYINEQKSTAILSSCVLVDLIDGKLQTCGQTENLKNIWQLVGV